MTPPRARKQANSPEPLGPTRLLVPVSDGESFLAAEIAVGREIAATSISSMDDLRAAELRADRWRDNVKTWLDVNLGGEGAREFRDAIRHVTIGGRADLHLEIDWFRRRLEGEVSKIESISDRLSLWANEPPPRDNSASGPRPAIADEAPIFIVHGHDVDRAEVVARSVERISGREAVILHEQPDGGRTLIEKFEDHGAEAAYAVIVLTPDDVGGPVDGALQPRGRQNVVFEMGYFFGRIGRSRVCVLYAPDVELPSDLQGLVYVPLDAAQTWKGKLERELKHAKLA